MQVKGKLPNLKSILQTELEKKFLFPCDSGQILPIWSKMRRKTFIGMLGLSWRYYSLFFNFFFLAIASAFKRVRKFIYMLAL